MPLSSLFQLLALGAIWGSSFLFMRLAVPTLGPVMLIESRLMLASIFLLILTVVLKKQVQLIKHWKHFLFLGTFNTAFPFILLAYASKHLPVSLLVVLNATGPIWAVFITFLLTQKLPPLQTVVGTLLGLLGVYILVADNNSFELTPRVISSICAGLTATIGYAMATVYTARSQVKVDSFANAYGSMWCSALILLPVVPFYPAYQLPSTEVIIGVLILGVVCSAIAYLLYFKLITDIGPTPALSVTYLIPMFGMLWGALFLEEDINWHHIVGAITVVMGTAFVAGINIKNTR